MKKYMFGVISLLMAVVLFLLPNNLFGNRIKINYELEKEKEAIFIYYVVENEIIGVPIYNISTDKYTQIKEVFMYLTEKSNGVNEKYETYVNLNTKLISYDVIHDSIFLEINDSFFVMDEEDTNYTLGQILYTYQDLGFKNIFLKYEGKIVEQVNSIPIYNGINNLAINISYKANSINTKTVKVIYCYKDYSKSFINYIINSNEDNMSFILEELIQFINDEYEYNVSLISYKNTNNYLNLSLKINESEEKIVKKIINENINNVIYNFIYF